MAPSNFSQASPPVGVSAAPFVSATPYALNAASAGDLIEMRARRRLPMLFGIAVVLSLTALSISGYLTYVAFTASKVLGCGGGTFDCEHVLTSKWSTMLGIPVAAWASTLYLTVLATLVATARPAMSSLPTVMRNWSWAIVTTAAVSAGVAALWFTGLQVFSLGHLCPWCLGAHACGLLLCVATLTMSPLSGGVKATAAVIGTLGAAMLVGIQVATPAPPTYVIENFPAQSAEALPGAGTPTDSAPNGGVFEPEMFDAPTDGDEVLSAPVSDAKASTQKTFDSLAAIAALWLDPNFVLTTQIAASAQDSGQANAGQANSSQSNGEQTNPAQAAAQASEDRLVQVASANVKLKSHQWPIIGSPNAKHIFVELFDYTCPHCRATQQAIRGARERFKGELAVIVLAVPLSRACNDTVTTEHSSHRESCDLAKYSIAVWRIAPDKFEQYHEYLMTTEPVPSAALAKSRAAQLVGAEALDKELAQPNVARYISKHVEMYRKMGAGPIPKLVFATTALTGEMRSVQVLCDTIESQFGK